MDGFAIPYDAGPGVIAETSSSERPCRLHDGHDLRTWFLDNHTRHNDGDEEFEDDYDDDNDDERKKINKSGKKCVARYVSSIRNPGYTTGFDLCPTCEQGDSPMLVAKFTENGVQNGDIKREGWKGSDEGEVKEEDRNYSS